MKNFFLIILLILLPIAVLPQIPDQQAASPAQITQSETNLNIAEPQNVLVVFKRGNSVSEAIKDHYVSVRNIPSVNIVCEGENNLPGLDFSGNTDIELAQNGEVIKRISQCANANSNGYCDYVAWQYYIDEIATPIANYLNNTIDPNTGLYLKDQIRYIVLCKGIPLKIQSGDPYRNWYTINVSVDGLLCLLKNDNNNNPSVLTLYPPTTPPGIIDHYNALVGNPYYSPDYDLTMNYRFKPNHFLTEHGNNGQYLFWKLAYLVSRLDGRNLDDVIQLIVRSVAADHSGEGKWIIDTHKYYSSDFYFPLEPWKADWYASDYNDLDLYRLMWTNNKLNNLDFNVVTDANEIDNTRRNPITTTNGQVMGYLSWGAHAGMQVGYINNLNFSYLPGAVFSSIESFNGYSMDAQFRRDGQGMITEFIQKGGTSGAGQTWEPFSNNVTNPFHSFSAYAMGYGFVDAMYQGYYRVGWQNIVVGDPLTTIAWGKQSLTENKTLTGTNLVTGVITIPSGKTLTIAANAVINFKYSGSLVVNGNLTIQQGAKLNFLNGASLIVNGALNANGTTTNKITFDFSSPNSTTQNGIKFNSGSSGTINYAIVKNGYYGVSVTGNPTGTINITNSAISTSSYAVYISGNTSSNVNITGCDIGTSSGGINLNSAVANIDGCTIHNITTYGGGAVVFNNSGGTIKNCNIQNNSIATNGISILNNSSPYVFQNTIANNTLNGVYVLQASPSLQSNAISTTGYGHAAVSNNSYSHTLFGKTSYPFDGYNTISGSYYGIYVGDHSLIQAGYSDIARYNRILGNTYNTYVTGTSTLYAKNDWWGAYQPDTTKFYKEAGSYFYYLPYLTTDPSGSQSIVSSRGLSASADAVSTGAAYTQEEELLLKAKELQEKDQLSEAIDIYKELIKTNSEKSIAEIALLELNNIYRNTKDKNIKEYFKEFKLSQNNQKRLYPIALVILSLNNKREKNFTESLDDCETLIKEFSSTEHEKNALMNKFFLYYDNNDFTSAKTVVEKLANSFAESPEVGTAINLLSMQTIENEKMLPKMKAVDNTVTENLPESYELNNYPNPFNPVTTIAYQLPKEGFVTIRVFDILGKEVKTLVNEYKEIGNYTVPFDASTLTSGMYIYQLQVNDYTSTKKMLLLK